MQPYEKGKGNPPQTREMMIEKIYHSDSKIDDTYLPLLGAKHIKRHYLKPFNEYIKYGKNLAAPRNPDIFKGERILINRILSKETINGVMLSETYINNTDIFNLLPLSNNTISLKVLYLLIVSKLCATYFKPLDIYGAMASSPRILRVNYTEFREKTLHLLQLTRSAIFNFVFCVLIEGEKDLTGQGVSITLFPKNELM